MCRNKPTPLDKMRSESKSKYGKVHYKILKYTSGLMQLKRITLFHKDTNASVSIVDYLYGRVVLLGCLQGKERMFSTIRPRKKQQRERK